MEKYSTSQIEDIIAYEFYPSPETRAAKKLFWLGVTEKSLGEMIATGIKFEIASNILLKVRNELRDLEKANKKSE